MCRDTYVHVRCCDGQVVREDHEYAQPGGEEDGENVDGDAPFTEGPGCLNGMSACHFEDGFCGLDSPPETGWRVWRSTCRRSQSSTIGTGQKLRAK